MWSLCWVNWLEMRVESRRDGGCVDDERCGYDKRMSGNTLTPSLIVETWC